MSFSTKKSKRPDLSYSEIYECDEWARVLWLEVLNRAMNDFRIYITHKADSKNNPVSEKLLRSIETDGSNPEYWFFGENTGFESVCLVLDIKPNIIRSCLQSWVKDLKELLQH